MSRVAILVTSTVAVLALAAHTASAAAITIGNPSGGAANAFPFSGLYQSTDLANEYQQIYSGALFGAGALTIDSISFYAAVPGGKNADGTYTLSLSTSSAAVNGLSPTMATNVGSDSYTFFSGLLPAYPAAVGNLLTFVLPTPFLFIPEGGNLLLDVMLSGVTDNSFTGAFYVAQNGDFGNASSRMVNGLAVGTTGYGLVTTFDTAPAPVPEPASLLLLATGLAGVVRRRFKNAEPS